MKPTLRQPRPRHVLLAFALYLTATTAVWIVGALVASAGAPPHTAKEAIAAGMLNLTPVLLPASEVAGGLTVLLVLYRWAKRLDGVTFLDIVPARWGTARQLLLGGGAGAALGLAFALLSGFVPHHPTHPPSVLMQAASLPGPTRWAWIVSALLLAPPIEEAMFRGAFLGGLAQAWGWPAGMLLSGATFWGLHATEWLDYWPAAASLGALTLLVTVLRVRTRTLGACITAHFAYNLVLALAAFGFHSHGGA
jgi:membrane protease YdiL (CAAX protease family)